MKPKLRITPWTLVRRLTVPLAELAAAAGAVAATIHVPSDGSDGVLTITTNIVAPNITVTGTNIVIDLGMAVDGAWNDDNSAQSGLGVYDFEKWAVVFKYSSVSIAAGTRVTFRNHPSKAPVVWLVDGDVTINGILDLSGANGVAAPGHAEPGPGGFRGGRGYYAPGVGAGSGFGPGGGRTEGGWWGSGGSYGAQASGTPPAYGNPSLVPLIGGSGAGGDGDEGWGGGAGGGAILIAAAGSVTVDGRVDANGGNRPAQNPGGGSGGGIRIVTGDLAGNGMIRALGGIGQGNGTVGRIQIERLSASGNPTVIPDPGIVPLVEPATALIWPPDDGPTVRVVSIGGGAVPADPRADFGVSGPDVALPETASTQVVVETVNVESASQVQVRVTPRGNANFTTADAAVETVVSDTPLVIRWVATLPVTVGYSAVQVKVVRP
ncbi:MAG: hypothetical protein KF833_06390 [Verrucomicrobiae bacterium]|nr:hypothetical protein [Verrucomicrobiae bacterium]